MRTFAVTIAIALSGLAVASGAPTGTAGSGAVAAAAVPVGQAAKAPTRGVGRCRSVARRRLARMGRTARARGLAGIGDGARARVRRKLRRCLAAAGAPAEAPGGTPDGGPSPTPGTPTTPTAPSSPTLPSFVGVTASDSDGFRLALSRPAVAAGSVTVELRNTDSGPHDLVVRPEAGGTAVAQFDEAEPGAVLRKQAALSKGRWYLYCSLPGHEAAGMHVTLRAE